MSHVSGELGNPSIQTTSSNVILMFTGPLHSRDYHPRLMAVLKLIDQNLRHDSSGEVRSELEQRAKAKRDQCDRRTKACSSGGIRRW